jgi:hypothetical protein
MDSLSKTSKIFLFLGFSALTLWLGSYVARHMIIYQLFEPENLDLKNMFNSNNIESVIKTIAPVFVLNMITFIVFLLMFMVLIFISKFNIKENGWILIIVLAVFITAPFELYLLYTDFLIIKKVYFSSSFDITIIDSIKERITVLNSFSLIEIFTYLGIIFLIVFRPLTKK